MRLKRSGTVGSSTLLRFIRIILPDGRFGLAQPNGSAASSRNTSNLSLCPFGERRFAGFKPDAAASCSCRKTGKANTASYRGSTMSLPRISSMQRSFASN